MTFINENEIKGKSKKLKGKIREELGEVTGDTEQQIKGKGEQIKGELQEVAGKTQRKLSD